MGIITFGNPQLLVDAQWYPPPQGDPQDIRSFAEETPYICCVGKTHLVFRMLFAKNYSGFRNVYQKTGIGIEVLLQHNLSEESLKTINAFLAAELQKVITWNAGDIAKIITEYCSWDNINAEILYPLVIQEAILKRKETCSVNNNPANNKLLQQGLRDVIPASAQGNPEDLEDMYSCLSLRNQPVADSRQFATIVLQNRALVLGSRSFFLNHVDQRIS